MSRMLDSPRRGDDESVIARKTSMSVATWRAILTATLTACISAAGWSPAWAGEEFEAHTLSSRDDMVSGGTALVELRAPRGSHWTAVQNGREVTASFRGTGEVGRYIALLTGLSEGKNTLQVLDQGVTRATLEIVSHPLRGPLFSGPHQEPFVPDGGERPGARVGCGLYCQNSRRVLLQVHRAAAAGRPGLDHRLTECAPRRARGRIQGVGSEQAGSLGCRNHRHLGRAHRTLPGPPRDRGTSTGRS